MSLGFPGRDLWFVVPLAQTCCLLMFNDKELGISRD